MIARDLVDITTDMILEIDSEILDAQLFRIGRFREQDLGDEVIDEHTNKMLSEPAEQGEIVTMTETQEKSYKDMPLVSPKLSGLCTYLLACKVRLQSLFFTTLYTHSRDG